MNVFYELLPIFFKVELFAICSYLCFEYESVPKQTCLDMYRNDDEINSTSEYSRSSSDVLNFNSKQKKKKVDFFTFLQSDFKLIELGTYLLLSTRTNFERNEGKLCAYGVGSYFFAFLVYFLIKQINFHHELLIKVSI